MVAIVSSMEQAISYFSSNFDHEQEFNADEIRQALCEHGVNPLVADGLLLSLTMEQEAETGSSRIPMARLLVRLAEFNENGGMAPIDRLPSVHSVDFKHASYETGDNCENGHRSNKQGDGEDFLVANGGASLGSLNPWAASGLMPPPLADQAIEAIRLDWVSVDWVGVEGGLLTGHATFRVELQAGRRYNRQVLLSIGDFVVSEFAGGATL